MKKLISILLVAMLIIGMFPATTLTAFAAPTEETISFNSLSQRVSQTTTSQVWKSDNITFTNNKGSSSTNVANYSNPVRIYGKSDLIIECSAGKMTSILFVSNGGSDYKASLNSSLTAAGVTFSNSGNNYTVTFAEGVESFSFQNASTKQIRLHSMTVTYEAGGSTEPDEPACQHPNTELQNEADASCTVDGYTGDEVCLDCGETVDEGEVILAGHTYVDGVCSVCGEAKPAGYLEAAVATLKSTDQVIVTVINTDGNTYALTNGGGTSNAPAATKVSVTDGTIDAEDVTDALIWNIVYNNGNIEIYPKDTTSTWLYCTATNNGVRVGTNTNKTFTIDASSGYLKHTGTSRYIGVYNNQDWRCYTSVNNNIAGQTLKFYKLSGGTTESCEHTNTEPIPAVAATCTNTGLTAGVKCSNCGEILTAQETTPALGHNYVDGTCTNEGCGVQDPLYTLPGRYYIAATRNSGSYYMTSDLGTKDTKRYTAVETGLETLPTEISDPTFGYVFIVTRNQDGSFSIQAEGIPGDNYLGWISGNSGILTADKNISFTATANEDGTFTFANSANRYLSLNNSGDDWFAWYESVQKRDLTLIPVTGAKTAPAASADGRYFATAEEAIAAAAAVESKTVTLLAPAGDVEVDGDLVIDLNGNSIDSLTVSGTLKAYDSEATTADASGAKIKSVNAGEIVMDNTVGDVRYIALCDGDTYSFHALELKLTAVTLRTCGAGPNGASTNIPGAGLYYKAAIVCDPTLAAYVNENREKCSFGLVLSLVNMPGSDFMTETEDAYTVATAKLESRKDFTSGILNNIFKHGLDADENAARGTDNIYANAYLNLNGTIYMADTADAENSDGAVFSLMTVMQALDESYDTLKEAQQTMLLDFYKTWQAAMSTWTLTNIAAAYTAQQPA